MIHIRICQSTVSCCKASVAKGFAASNSFLTLLSPCSEGSGETLARRFHVPTTRTLTPILSAAHIYASGQSLWTERLYADQSADSCCRASAWGNHSRVQLSSSLRPQILPIKTITWISVQQARTCPQVTSATSEEPQTDSFKLNPRGNSGQ